MSAVSSEFTVRAELERSVGKVWNTNELVAEFEVKGFSMGCVVVRRLSDGALGSLDFMHMPRLYFGFVEHK
jgi:hypothetical protein